MKEYKLIRSDLGYFEIENKPSLEELTKFYSEKYFQDDSRNFKKIYSDEDLEFYSLEVKLCLATLEKYLKFDTNLLDLGCGEGFFQQVFLDRDGRSIA